MTQSSPYALLGACAVLALVALAGCSSTSSSHMSPMPSMSGMSGMPMGTGSSSSGSTTSTPAGAPTVTTVNIRDFRFDPAPVPVQAGVTIHFVNSGQATHTVTIHDPQTDTMVQNKQLAPGESVDVTFPHAGTYHLTCNIHNSMATTVEAQ